MVRSVPEGRFAALVETATKTFVARGYRLTQMADVADALGVAKGTLYCYVESKEALFDAAVRFADDLPSSNPAKLPLPTPASGSTVRYIQTRLVDAAQDLELVRVLSQPKGARARPDEFERIVRDLYRRMFANRRALVLVDRCAMDFPDLAAVWFEQGRQSQVSLIATYFEKRVADRKLRPIPNVPLAARMVLETIALWAIHMPWDASPHSFDDDVVETSVVDMLTNAYAKKDDR